VLRMVVVAILAEVQCPLLADFRFKYGLTSRTQQLPGKKLCSNLLSGGGPGGLESGGRPARGRFKLSASGWGARVPDAGVAGDLLRAR